MRVPVEWLNEYVKTDKTPNELSASFTLLGLLHDKPVKPGDTNPVLELEHRMDRSDWLSVIGCARDLAAFEQIPFNYPPVHAEKGKEPTPGSKVRIAVECEDLVNRFNTRVFRNVTVKDSPDWLKRRLESYGIPSINNVVDITNYVMVEYGQPMHAQDIDKMEKPEIVIRRARAGEKITTLLGETLELDTDAFVLTQSDKPTVIGGIVGGAATGVGHNTKNIVLDAGNYNQTNVRRTSRRLKIQNETVQRYDKFLHPYLTQVAIERAAHLILEHAGGEYYENEDWYPEEWGIKEMSLRLSRVNQMSGMEFGLEKVREILSALEYTILELNENDDSIKVQVPYFRTDVEVEDDLVADVLRIHGYEKIPQKPIEGTAPKQITPEIVRFEEALRDELVKLGLHEHITDPLVGYRESATDQVILTNALSSEKNALRTSIYETLKPVVQTYKKHRKEEIGLFEVGKTYSLSGKGTELENYDESRETVVVYENTGGTVEQNNRHLRRILSGLLQNLGIESVLYESSGTGANLYQGELMLGTLDMRYITLFNEALMDAQRGTVYIEHQIPNIVFEDLSLVIDSNQPFGPVYNTMRGISKDIKDIRVLEEFTDVEKLGESKKAILVRLEFDGNRLDPNTIVDIKTSILKNLKNEFGISTRE